MAARAGTCLSCNAARAPAAGRVQARLDEATGLIHVCYPDTLSAGNVGDNGAEATAGIQQTSTDGINYSCNTPVLTSGLLLLYVPM